MKNQGAQPKNQNATKECGHKEYYPIRYGGRRWTPEEGAAIKAHLAMTGESWSGQLRGWVFMHVFRRGKNKNPINLEIASILKECILNLERAKKCQYHIDRLDHINKANEWISHCVMEIERYYINEEGQDHN